jgi:hypothetical protein
MLRAILELKLSKTIEMLRVFMKLKQKHGEFWFFSKSRSC